jgi:hypothetical protein
MSNLKGMKFIVKHVIALWMILLAKQAYGQMPDEVFPPGGGANVTITLLSNAVSADFATCLGGPGGTPGAFRVTRSAPLTNDLTVFLGRASDGNLSMGGSGCDTCDGSLDYEADYGISCPYYFMQNPYRTTNCNYVYGNGVNNSSCWDAIYTNTEGVIIPAGQAYVDISVAPIFSHRCSTNLFLTMSLAAATNGNGCSNVTGPTWVLGDGSGNLISAQMNIHIGCSC